MTTQAHAAEPLLQPKPLASSIGLKLGAGLAAGAGAAAFAWALARGEAALAWSAYLIGAFYTLGLGLFGVLWISILYLSKGAWSVSMRRIPEAMASWLVPGALLTLAVLAGGHHLYPWADPRAVAADELLRHKAPFLDTTLFAVLVGGSCAVWALFGWLLVRNSRKQDTTGDAGLSHTNTQLSALFVVLYALTFSVASFYLLMSREAHWYSTMYGVLAFTDMMQAGLAFVALVAAALVAQRRLPGLLNENHLHSVAKMLFAVTGFWAYIYFCQFMLIWYSNVPEEVVYFTRRTSHGWLPYLLFVPLVKFLLPFLLLLRRAAKRSTGRVMGTALLVLFAEFVELFLLVGPAAGHAGASVAGHLPLVELLVTVGFLGLFVVVFARTLARHNAVPLKDPRLRDCLELHQ